MLRMWPVSRRVNWPGNDGDAKLLGAIHYVSYAEIAPMNGALEEDRLLPRFVSRSLVSVRKRTDFLLKQRGDNNSRHPV